MTELPDLVDRQEIGKRLGVAVRTIDSWRRRDLGFPQPINNDQWLKLWIWEDVQRWCNETNHPRRD